MAAMTSTPATRAASKYVAGHAVDIIFTTSFKRLTTSAVAEVPSALTTWPTASCS